MRVSALGRNRSFRGLKTSECSELGLCIIRKRSRARVGGLMKFRFPWIAATKTTPDLIEFCYGLKP